MGDWNKREMALWVVFGLVAIWLFSSYWRVTRGVFPTQAAVAYWLLIFAVIGTFGWPLWYYVIRPIKRANELLAD